LKHPQVAVAEYVLNIWIVAADILNRHSLRGYRWWTSRFEVRHGVGLIEVKTITLYYTGSWNYLG
jgi:hypothetical protein